MPPIDVEDVRDAVRSGNIQLVGQFQSQGFDLDVPSSSFGFRYPLLYYARAPLMIIAMIGYGVDINRQDVEGFTTLNHALRAHYENCEVVRTLIRLGADVSIVSHYNMTAIEHAVKFVEGVRTGINPNAAAIADSLQLTLDTYEDEVWKRSQVAFAMALHPRLGVDSPVSAFDLEVLRMVLDRVW